MNNNIVKETVYTLLAKGLSDTGQREGLWFAGHIEAIYMAFKAYTEELNKIDVTPKTIDKALPLNMPTHKRFVFINKALEIRKDIVKTNQKRLAALEGLLKDFDNLTEKQKEDAYNMTEQ